MVKITVGTDAFTPTPYHAVAAWCWHTYRFQFVLDRDKGRTGITPIKRILPHLTALLDAGDLYWLLLA
jgi:hypothetical protein